MFSESVVFEIYFELASFSENRRLKFRGFTVLFFQTGPEVIKLFSCSTQLSMKFQMLIKTFKKIPKMKKFLALSLSDVELIMLINVKMPIIVGILTFMSRINFVLS